MKRIIAGTVLLVCLTLSFGTSAFAASTKSTSTVVASPLTNATVNLYCRLKAGKVIYSPSGSGVFIGDRGVILTNAHVAQYFLLAGEKGRVTGWCSVRTGSPAEETYTADVLYISPKWLSDNISKISQNQPSATGENDFALLYVTGAKKGPLPATFPSLSVSTEIPMVETNPRFAGYSVDGLDFSGVRNKLSVLAGNATIESTQGFHDSTQPDTLTIIPSTAASFGVSGGPVVNDANSIIGLIVAKSTSKTSLKLRALSLPYINANLRIQTGVSLASILTSDFPTRAAITRLMFPENIVADLAKGLRSKK